MGSLEITLSGSKVCKQLQRISPCSSLSRFGPEGGNLEAAVRVQHAA